MKKLTIVGAGMGTGTVTADGRLALENADTVFGSPRLTSLLAPQGKTVSPVYRSAEISSFMEEKNSKQAVLLVSGDTGFYSAAAAVARELDGCEVSFVPGISSVNYFFARLGRDWQDAKLLSCHGRRQNLTDAVRRNRLTFALTGDNCPQLAKELTAAGYGGLTVYTGQNLGSSGEEIRRTTAEALSAEAPCSLTVLLIENPAADSRVRTGLADGLFVRGEVPMTKAEVRAVSLSRLAPRPADTCLDIGCGTGSVTVELALAAYEGQVYAIDRNEEAVALTAENCRRFHLGNVTVLNGSVPAALAAVPPADVVFVGGAGGTLADILKTVLAANPQARIVVNAIAPETAADAFRAFRACGLEAEAVQVSCARAKAAGSLHLMLAQNPVYIISGGGRDE